MTAPEGQISSIDCLDLSRVTDAVLLDVREPDEWLAGHAPGALHIPFGELAARTGELPTDRPVVCICRSGGRSRKAAELLAGKGFDVHNLNGGMRAWSASGSPVVTPEGTVGSII